MPASSPTIDMVAPSEAILAAHRLAPLASGEVLEAAVLRRSAPPVRAEKKANPPPGKEALKKVARLLSPVGCEPSVGVSVYGESAERR